MKLHTPPAQSMVQLPPRQSTSQREPASHLTPQLPPRQVTSQRAPALHEVAQAPLGQLVAHWLPDSQRVAQTVPKGQSMSQRMSVSHAQAEPLHLPGVGDEASGSMPPSEGTALSVPSAKS